MKKFLLLACVALMSVSAFAVDLTESDTLYATTNGVTCVNKWLMCNNLNKAALQQYAYLNTAKCRTACLHNGVIYVGNSTNDDAAIVDSKGNTIDCCGIETFDAATGAHLGHLKVSYNGRRISDLLCANQVGFDNFGHLYVAGYVGGSTYGYTIYVVDPATGVASDSLHFTMTNAGRIDYCDVVGDLTRVEANCTVMAAADPPAADATVYRWSAAKGGTFAGGWNEDGDDSFVMSELYPATQTTWNTGSIVRMVLGEGDAMYNGDLFYVDGFNTYPTLYNTTGGIVDSFANATDLTPKNAGTNGVNEIQLGDKHFIVYSNNQHTGDQGGNEAEVCQLGEGDAFTGMTQYWQIPKHGLGMTSDTGTRIHCISKEYVKDANGKLACNLLVFKTMNGMGLYQIAEDGFNPGGVKAVNAAPAAVITVNGGIITVSATASSIAIYNVAGQLVSMVKNASQVAAPANGLYIVKAVVNGQSIVKKVVL